MKEQIPVVIYLSNPGAKGETEKLHDAVIKRYKTPFFLYGYAVDDWDSFLTPWPAEGCFPNRNFAGRGKELLRLIEEEIIPDIHKKYENAGKIYIAGYSLAGLFSLWALGQSGLLDGAVCCSGSLWYPGWDRYMETVVYAHPVEIYLSLGNKEPLTRNQVMRQVGERTERQFELLKQSPMVKNVTFEWNEGGHFSCVEERMTNGIGWILGK